MAAAQLEVARAYGFPSGHAFKAYIDTLTVDGQLLDAAKRGDVERPAAVLDAHPDWLYARSYEWTLLHVAANESRLAAVDLLLARGLDANTRERGDNTYAMHWAAVAGHVEGVERAAQRRTRGPACTRGAMDLVAVLALGDWPTAERWSEGRVAARST